LSQLYTLIWLKWTLFRNSLRSAKNAINSIASALAMVIALGVALLVATGLGIGAYALTAQEQSLNETHAISTRAVGMPPAELVFFGIFSFCFLLWATLPLSTGTGRQFDPGRMLMYPISLRKLFAVDLISDITSLPSVFAVPAILAVGLGAGLAQGMVFGTLLAMIPTVAFGLALSKWLSTFIGSLTRKRRTRGESVLALIGAVVALTGAVIGQIAPVLFRHAGRLRGLRWTPPGAAAFVLTGGQTPINYWLAVGTVTSYAVLLIIATYWLAKRSVLGLGQRLGKTKAATPGKQTYVGWEFPLLSSEVSAILEKELRYLARNAQIRVMGMMPFILIVVRLMNTKSFGQSGASPRGAKSLSQDFYMFGGGLMATAGVLYVFLLLAGLWCNQFAFEEGGMRSLILSPIRRDKILLAKNIAITVLALSFSAALLIINQLVFGDLTPGTILFVALSFVTFSSVMALIGNWLSIRFPKRMNFGKRLNVSGVVGLLLIPIIAILGLPVVGATAAGYLTRSLFVEYVTLSVIAALAVGFYLLTINAQGQSLQRREIDVLEAVREPADE